MIKKTIIWTFVSITVSSFLFAQSNSKEILNEIEKEVYQNSQLEEMAVELIDGIGPRLIGTKNMENAHNWAVNKFKSWGIESENQEYGTWLEWERGVSEITMTYPRFQQLEGMQLAYSPNTSKKGVEAEVIILPENIKDSLEFAQWLNNVKGKIVLVSPYIPSGRPLHNWEKFAREETYIAMKTKIEKAKKEFQENIKRTGYNTRYTLTPALEEAGAVGIIMSYWSEEYGAQKIFDAKTKKIPTVDISLEDYGLLYRLVQNEYAPKVKIKARSKFKGTSKTWNTIATIPGSTKSDEYVILSAHLDSWDGGTGATDNGTGVLTMMEVARVLKKVYPNPKRTIIIGLWGGEEQGLNGSRAFIEDHPHLKDKIQVVFNQDSGTGRIVGLAGQGFLDAYDYLGRWLALSQKNVTEEIETDFPGYPGYRGSDHAAFVAYGIPAFYLESKTWDYRTLTWHTNRDTYDKIVFDDLKNNVLLVASLAYWASEEEEQVSRRQRKLKINEKTGEMDSWPSPGTPKRSFKEYK